MIRAAADAMFGMAEAIMGGLVAVWDRLAGSLQAVYDGQAASGMGEPDFVLEGVSMRQRMAVAEARAADDFRAMRFSAGDSTTPLYHTGTIQALPDSEPSVTVRCQYCGVGGQDPDAGTCGRCGGPFPEVPRRLGSIIWPEAPLPGYVTR